MHIELVISCMAPVVYVWFSLYEYGFRCTNLYFFGVNNSSI